MGIRRWGIRDDSSPHNFVAATADTRVAAPSRHLQRESSARPADPTTANKPSRFGQRYSPSARSRPVLVRPQRFVVPASVFFSLFFSPNVVAVVRGYLSCRGASQTERAGAPLRYSTLFLYEREGSSKVG